MDNKDIGTIIMIIVVLGIIYFLYSRNNTVTLHDDTDHNSNTNEHYDQENFINVNNDATVPPTENVKAHLEKKMLTVDSNPPGAPPQVISYAAGNRDQYGKWVNEFNESNDVIINDYGSNNDFAPIESGTQYASVNFHGSAPCGSGQSCTPEQLFNIDKMLPQEVNNDWFQVQPDPVSVKNKHLINTVRPIGVNTIGTANKNQSYDIRGTPANPKFVVSPFLNSSIEPDYNQRLSLC